MARLDIDIILLDESVVMNGFRCLMSGASLDDFRKNPVMLFMHNRASAGIFDPADNDILLPIGKWYDIRVDGDKLIAKPDFDDDDDFALKIQNKVKKGYLNAASVWIDPIAADDSDDLKLPGQKGVTLSKWGVLESSIVDIPNCRGALAIRNSAGRKITLSGKEADTEILNYLKTFVEMKKEYLLAVGLPETATEAEYLAKLNELKLAAQNAATGSHEVTQLKTDLLTAQQRLTELSTAAETKKVEELVDGAIAGNKLLAGDRDNYLKLAKADYATTKILIDAMKPHTTIESRLAASGNLGGNDVELQELIKLSGRELYMNGKLDRLKAISQEYYKLKFKDYFGIEPKD